MAGGQEKWYFTKEQLQNSPSRKCGLDADKELAYRQQAANLIQDMGQRLQVSQLCINTAIVYMHRFYAFHSFTQFHRNAIAAAALFLAAKVEEQPRKLEYVIKVAHVCLHRGEGVGALTSDQYQEQAQDLVFNENVLLQTLGFDVAIDHPHTHVVRTCHLVKAPKDLAQTSYFMASNSLHLTTMCLQYRPTVVACFCIHLASKWSNWAIPQSNEGRHWFSYVDRSVTMDLLEKLTSEFLIIFEKCPSRLKRKMMNVRAADGSSPHSGAAHASSAAPSSSSKHAPPPADDFDKSFDKEYERERRRQPVPGGYVPASSAPPAAAPPNKIDYNLYREKREREERERRAALQRAGPRAPRPPPPRAAPPAAWPPHKPHHKHPHDHRHHRAPPAPAAPHAGRRRRRQRRGAQRRARASRAALAPRRAAAPARRAAARGAPARPVGRHPRDAAARHPVAVLVAARQGGAAAAARRARAGAGAQEAGGAAPRTRASRRARASAQRYRDRPHARLQPAQGEPRQAGAHHGADGAPLAAARAPRAARTAARPRARARPPRPAARRGLRPPTQEGEEKEGQTQTQGPRQEQRGAQETQEGQRKGEEERAGGGCGGGCGSGGGSGRGGERRGRRRCAAHHHPARQAGQPGAEDQDPEGAAGGAAAAARRPEDQDLEGSAGDVPQARAAAGRAGAQDGARQRRGAAQGGDTDGERALGQVRLTLTVTAARHLTDVIRTSLDTCHVVWTVRPLAIPCVDVSQQTDLNSVKLIVFFSHFQSVFFYLFCFFMDALLFWAVGGVCILTCHD